MEFTTHFKLQSQATRLDKDASCSRAPPRNRTLTFSATLFQGIFAAGTADGAFLDHNSGGARPPDWQRELRPLHSPLLGASWLVSSPPLSDMLKFSG